MTERLEPELAATVRIIERNIEQLNNILYGPQDYAVIATNRRCENGFAHRCLYQPDTLRLGWR